MGNLEQLGEVEHFGAHLPDLNAAREELIFGGHLSHRDHHGRPEIDYFVARDPDGLWLCPACCFPAALERRRPLRAPISVGVDRVGRFEPIAYGEWKVDDAVATLGEARRSVGAGWRSAAARGTGAGMATGPRRNSLTCRGWGNA